MSKSLILIKSENSTATMDEEKVALLIVDDSDVIRNSLKNFFSDYNFDVITCQDGLEGIQKAAEYKPALIFLDLMMPNLDGVKMLQVIKVLEGLKDIPVIVISGNTNRTNVLAAIEAGADKVISKPLQKEIIIKNINEILGPEFLAKSKKKKIFSHSDSEDIRKRLRIMFLDGYYKKKEFLSNALDKKDRTTIRNIAHEFKGAGGTIGFPKLSLLSGLVEEQVSNSIVNWTYVRLLCEQIFTLAEEIKNYSLTNS